MDQPDPKGPPNLPAQPPAAGEAAAPRGSNTTNQQPAPAAPKGQGSSTINQEAFLAFLASQHIVAGPQATRKLQVIQHNPAFPPSSALLLRSKALALLQPSTIIPTNTLRLTLSSGDARLFRAVVETELLAHFNKGQAAFPLLLNGPLPAEYEGFTPCATGIRFGQQRAAVGRPLAQVYNVSFASRAAYEEALALPPYQRGNRQVVAEAAAEHTERIIELHFNLPTLTLGAKELADALSASLPKLRYTLLQIQRSLSVSPTTNNGLPVSRER